MKLRKVLWPLLLALLLTHALGAILEEGGEEGGEEGEEGLSEEQIRERTSALVVVTVLIALSIMFELGKELLEEKTSEELKPVVEHMFGELTVLGFLSLLTFLIVQIGAKTGNQLSVLIFGEEEEELLSELIEWIHMSLFAVLVIFIVQVVLLIQLGEREKSRWERFEEICTSKEKEKVIEKYRQHVRAGKGQESILWKIMPFLNPTQRLEEIVNYICMRQEFINPRDPTASRLPRDFDFSMYLSICLGEVLGDMVEISPRTWFCLEVFFVFGFLVSFIPTYWAPVTIFLLFGWLLLAAMFFLVVKLNRVKLKLIPLLDAEVSINEQTGLLDDTSLRYPRFLREMKPARRSGMASRFYGKTSNKQERLFWFDSNGPAFAIFIVRLVILLSAIFLAVLFVFCLKVPEYWYLAVLLPMGLIPIFWLGFFYTPRILRLWVTVCNIEMLKNQDAITKVLRTQRTAKSLQTLKVIQVMKFKIRRSSPEGAEEESMKKRSELPPEKKEAIREVFDLFDKDGSGDISPSELKDVFKALGQDINDVEARELVNELDADGDGELSFEEFCVYFEQCLGEEDEDPEEMIKSMYAVFDRDDDGNLTTDEFINTLQKLGSQLSVEDIQALVDEVDEDRDGYVSLEEFERLIRNHLFEERKGKARK